MTKTLELIADFITSPRTALSELKKDNYFGAAVLAAMLAVLSQNAADRMIVLNSGTQPFGLFTSSFVLAVLFFAMSAAFFCAWVHFVSAFYGSQANVKTMISAVLLSFTPLFLLLPVSSILLAWTSSPLAWYVFIVLVVYTWISWIIYVSVKDIYSLSAGRALFILASLAVFPLLIFIAAVLFVVILIATFFA